MNDKELPQTKKVVQIVSKLHHICPSCKTRSLHQFYSVNEVPVNSVLILTEKSEALNFPQGDINLAICSECGMITNMSFNENLIEYSNRYEETQGFSGTFNAFHVRLANYLIEKYDLHEKTIVEIGCGKGEFLALICEMGSNFGIGIDPTFLPARKPKINRGAIEYYADWYSKKYSYLTANLFLCKMTLEHIHNTFDFISMVRETIGDQPESIIFFQVPEVFRILQDLAFWDIYYEHCSYFSAGSLGRLFRKAGFNVRNLWTDYDNQYLMIEAVPNITGGLLPPQSKENDLSALISMVNFFSSNISTKLTKWKKRIDTYYQNGKRVVIWGGSSKTVSFITTLGIKEEIQYIVDINPYKKETFLPGGGQKVVMPEFLRSYRPDIVILMNPIYRKEVNDSLAKLDLNPYLITIND